MDRWNDTVYAIHSSYCIYFSLHTHTHIGRCRGFFYQFLLAFSTTLAPFSRPSFLTFFLPSFQPSGFRFLHLFLIDPGIRSNPRASKAQTVFQKRKSQYVKANSLVNSSLPYLLLAQLFIAIVFHFGNERGWFQESCWSYITESTFHRLKYLSTRLVLDRNLSPRISRVDENKFQNVA